MNAIMLFLMGFMVYRFHEQGTLFRVADLQS
jgi:hypothetical protein